ncbi:hypothetical protein Lal_00026052 [Lupinus albus]|uniref:Uncharacterized protein n=1 Tax=Lupinus albus TaxID=3870 RepID=A0A6A4Q073_LUPAL|nr:hypothetical protein Lalb_Chr09g0326501 [Lupinus albus]KAF1861650.1 hypothetical protein Lal_00026052 [Lupinus albus]
MNIIMAKRGVRILSSSSGRFLSSKSTLFNHFHHNLVPITSSDVDAPNSDIPVLSHASSVVTPIVSPPLLQPRVVLYDGVCHLCHRGVKWVIRADKDRKIKFCCVQSDTAEPYLKACGLEREDVLRRFLFIEGLNVYSQGSTAALRVLSYLPLPYSALSSLWVVPTPIRDAVYDYVARQRYEWFGKAEDCLVLKEIELLERFIDREEMMNRGRDM